MGFEELFDREAREDRRAKKAIEQAAPEAFKGFGKDKERHVFKIQNYGATQRAVYLFLEGVASIAPVFPVKNKDTKEMDYFSVGAEISDVEKPNIEELSSDLFLLNYVFGDSDHGIGQNIAMVKDKYVLFDTHVASDYVYFNPREPDPKKVISGLGAEGHAILKAKTEKLRERFENKTFVENVIRSSHAPLSEVFRNAIDPTNGYKEIVFKDEDERLEHFRAHMLQKIHIILEEIASAQVNQTSA